LFGVPCGEIRDGAVAGIDLWDDLACLEDRLSQAVSFEQRVRIATAELKRRLARSEDVAFPERLRRLTSTVPWHVPAAAVEARFGYSRSHSHRLCREWLGSSLGDHLRLRRFVAACELLCRPGASLAGVAAHLGFHDQAHFTRAFGHFAKLTPGQYRAFDPLVPGQLSVDGTGVQDQE
jgi:AraC-like DNA-binding protein